MGIAIWYEPPWTKFERVWYSVLKCIHKGNSYNMLSKCQKRKSSLILDEGICKENVYAHSWLKMYCLSTYTQIKLH